MVKTYSIESGHPAIFESASTGKAGAILGKLKAPFFDLNAPTRNGRDYREAAEDALESDEFRERIENRVFFGRLGHPMTEDECKEDPAVRACVVMTDYKKNPNTNMYEGTLEILNNQYGRQLKSLVDAGCIMGVSTRGSGDSYESADGTEVITRGTYDFEALDVVTMPAVKQARVTVMESVQRDQRKSLESLVESSTDKYVLESLKVTVESSNMPNRTQLLETINKKLSGGVETVEPYVNDIALLASKLREAEERASKAEKELLESKSSETVGNQATVVESANPNLAKLLRESTKLIESMKKELTEKRQVVESLESSKSELVAKNESLQAENQELLHRNEVLTESLGDSEKELHEAKKSYEALEAQKKSLEESIEKSKSENKVLTESMSKSAKVQTESLEKLNNQLRTLTESKNRAIAANKALKVKYIESVAVALGISLEALKLRVNEYSTVGQIDTAAKSIRESMDRAQTALPDPMKLGRVVKLESVEREFADPELDRAARVATMTNHSK